MLSTALICGRLIFYIPTSMCFPSPSPCTHVAPHADLEQQLAAARAQSAASHATVESLQAELKAARDAAQFSDRELRAMRADAESGAARQSGTTIPIRRSITGGWAISQSVSRPRQ